MKHFIDYDYLFFTAGTVVKVINDLSILNKRKFYKLEDFQKTLIIEERALILNI